MLTKAPGSWSPKKWSAVESQFSPGLLLVAVPVVVVGDAGVDLALVDALHHDQVVRRGPCRSAARPSSHSRGRLLALELEDGADDRLEVGAGRGEADPARPLRVGEVEDRRRQVGLGQRVGVVHRDRRAGQDAGPVAASSGRTRRGSGRAPPRRPGRTGPALSTMLIAGEFSVRKTSAGESSPSCDQLVGQLEVLAVAQLDVEPGLLLEERHDLVDQLLVLGVVDHQVGAADQRCSAVSSGAVSDAAAAATASTRFFTGGPSDRGLGPPNLTRTVSGRAGASEPVVNNR